MTCPKLQTGMNDKARSHILIVHTTLIFKEMLVFSATHKPSVECWLPVVTDHRQKEQSALLFTGVFSVLSRDLKTNLFMSNEGLEQRPHCNTHPIKHWSNLEAK